MSSAEYKKAKRKKDRPALVVCGDIVWRLVEDGQSPEDRYVMQCECGAVRFARHKNVHEITKCVQCTKAERKEHKKQKKAKRVKV